MIYIKTSFLINVKIQNEDFYNYLQEIKQSSRISKKNILSEYTKFSVKKELEIKNEKNDCLLFAERISLNNPNYDKKASVFSVSMGKKSKKFGTSDSDNSYIARQIRTHKLKSDPQHNYQVNPSIGDAYSMIPYNIPIDGKMCPYHAASVIFKDNNTNITL